jgi:hypothetical protein
VLQLTAAAAAAVLAGLEHAVRPERRNYLYDHDTDCSTRLRDLLDRPSVRTSP